MKLALTILLFFHVYFLFAGEVHAIVVLPALVLIPVIKFVVAIVGSLALPVLGISALWGKIKENSTKKGVLTGILVLVVVALFVGIIVWLQNPNRPLF